MNSDLIFRQTQRAHPAARLPSLSPRPPPLLRCCQPTALPTLHSTASPHPKPPANCSFLPPQPPSASPSPAFSRRLRVPFADDPPAPQGLGEGWGVFLTTSSVTAPGDRGGGGISLRKAGRARLTLTRCRRRAELSTGGTPRSWAPGARQTRKDTREAEIFLRRLRNSGRPRRG